MTALSVINRYTAVGAVKGVRFQSKDLLEFTATERKCIVCGCKATVHHLVRGRRTISSDILVVPLCFDHHDELDNHLSDRLFEQKYNVYLVYECVVNLELFLIYKGLASPTRVEHKRVNRGTAESKAKPGKQLKKLSKECNRLEDFK